MWLKSELLPATSGCGQLGGPTTSSPFYLFYLFLSPNSPGTNAGTRAHSSLALSSTRGLGWGLERCYSRTTKGSCCQDQSRPQPVVGGRLRAPGLRVPAASPTAGLQMVHPRNSPLASSEVGRACRWYTGVVVCVTWCTHPCVDVWNVCDAAVGGSRNTRLFFPALLDGTAGPSSTFAMTYTAARSGVYACATPP